MATDHIVDSVGRNRRSMHFGFSALAVVAIIGGATGGILVSGGNGAAAAKHPAAVQVIQRTDDAVPTTTSTTVAAVPDTTIPETTSTTDAPSTGPGTGTGSAGVHGNTFYQPTTVPAPTTTTTSTTTTTTTTLPLTLIEQIEADRTTAGLAPLTETPEMDAAAEAGATTDTSPAPTPSMCWEVWASTVSPEGSAQWLATIDYVGATTVGLATVAGVSAVLVCGGTS